MLLKSSVAVLSIVLAQLLAAGTAVAPAPCMGACDGDAIAAGATQELCDASAGCEWTQRYEVETDTWVMGCEKKKTVPRGGGRYPGRDALYVCSACHSARVC
eukprot:COSAG06_NODE_88_length_24864_cov_7.159368_16_plen_102_part_00